MLFPSAENLLPSITVGLPEALVKAQAIELHKGGPKLPQTPEILLTPSHKSL